MFKARLIVARAVVAFGLQLLLAGSSHGACNIVNGKAYGECTGVLLNTKPASLLQVKGSVEEGGMIAGAVVHSGGVLRLGGMSTGSIKVLRNGRVDVRGMANAVHCEAGGRVHIEGMVDVLRVNGCSATVSGTVGAVAGTGKVTFRAGSVLGGMPVDQAFTYPSVSGR